MNSLRVAELRFACFCCSCTRTSSLTCSQRMRLATLLSSALEAEGIIECSVCSAASASVGCPLSQLTAPSRKYHFCFEAHARVRASAPSLSSPAWCVANSAWAARMDSAIVGSRCTSVEEPRHAPTSRPMYEQPQSSARSGNRFSSIRPWGISRSCSTTTWIALTVCTVGGTTLRRVGEGGRFVNCDASKRIRFTSKMFFAFTPVFSARRPMRGSMLNQSRSSRHSVAAACSSSSGGLLPFQSWQVSCSAMRASCGVIGKKSSSASSASWHMRTSVKRLRIPLSR